MASLMVSCKQKKKGQKYSANTEFEVICMGKNNAYSEAAGTSIAQFSEVLIKK